MTGILTVWAVFSVLAGMAAGRYITARRRLLRTLAEDAALAEWCRHMSLTVVTHTGTVFSTTLPELQASEAPLFRSWNVPVQVTMWSDLLDDDLIADVPQDTSKDQLYG